jgi:tRNA dimethylallyltransferase
VEIISVDSALVYRGMDIGTAKPSAAELAAVPHHLIDIRDPLQAYSAAMFVADATRLIGEIQARGRRPLLVGGTMLYFKALFDGLDAMPAADPAVRARIAADAQQRGWPALHAALAAVDPSRRSGWPRTIHSASSARWRSGTPRGSLCRPFTFVTRRARPMAVRPDALISLEPQDRAWLHARIAQRFDAMLAAGFVDEVRACARAATCRPTCPACAAWVTARPGSHWTAPIPWRRCANAALPPRASWPSARSPGCAACRSARWWPATRPMHWRRCWRAWSGCHEPGGPRPGQTLWRHHGVRQRVAHRGAGEFVAIVGESGVGKSTLLNCMAALDTWDAGSITLDGTALGSLSAEQAALLRREKVGFVFQAFHVLPHLDVAQNVGLPLLLLGRPDAARVGPCWTPWAWAAWARGCRRP